ncbi:hypothetical protein J1N35_005082 [Gossypium stocksii]|uniref:Aminotransferase-like plant mobile domain-containing protein n=1 Tax=Gossypium stocksii TaxID=47602 RepID=A0A9D4AGP9_9ROSI|nr:hypothetical protein J1N35_005082 [Gossypium stocksii]
MLKGCQFIYGIYDGKVEHHSDMVATLVEKWRQKTLTFHFPFRETAITLKVITSITNLPINREVVIVDSTIGPAFKCSQFLYVLPSREKLEKDLDRSAHG